MLDSQTKKKLIEKTRAVRTQRTRSVLTQDITNCKQAEDIARRHSGLLESIRNAQSLFIRERLEQLGGSFDIDSVPGNGTTIFMKAPLNITNQ